MTDVRPIPPGFSTVTPHLIVRGAKQAIAFYEKAFGAEEIYANCLEGTDTVMHAQIRIGDSFVMLNDEFPDHGVLGPSADAGSPVTIHLYVDDVDAAYARATEAGAEVLCPLADAFWGDRYAQLKDPFGHRWSIATRVEELRPEEISERARRAFAQ
jgi:uncharacterized glyoxalase superfamily protein PhnB